MNPQELVFAQLSRKPTPAHRLAQLTGLRIEDAYHALVQLNDAERASIECDKDRRVTGWIRETAQ